MALCPGGRSPTAPPVGALCCASTAPSPVGARFIASTVPFATPVPCLLSPVSSLYVSGRSFSQSRTSPDLQERAQAGRRGVAALHHVQAVAGEPGPEQPLGDRAGPLRADQDDLVADGGGALPEQAVLLGLALGQLDHAGRDQHLLAARQLAEHGKRLGGAARVRVVGVVDHQHAAGALDRLEAVLDRLDAAGGSGDLGQRHPERQRRAGRGQHVHDVVPAEQPDLEARPRRGRQPRR